MIARPPKIPECGYVSDPDHDGDYTVCEAESVGLNKHGIARCQDHDGDHYKYAPAPEGKTEDVKPEGAIQDAFLAGRAQQTLADINVVEAKWRGSVLQPFYIRGLLDNASHETMNALCEGPANSPVLYIIDSMAERLAAHERRRKCIHDEKTARPENVFDVLAKEAFKVAKDAGIGILDAIMLAASVAQEVYGTKGLRVTLRFPWRKGRKLWPAVRIAGPAGTACRAGTSTLAGTGGVCRCRWSRTRTRRPRRLSLRPCMRRAGRPWRRRQGMS